ncbi:DUF3631 domain-containing protein [Mycobacterium palustre]|uniref:DNA primase n=1 Tax=Mycobacterium palustre TaxID=153971 RepID=A0A1X1Z9N7_9MYCO|nr:DUF3631 domain-containing protein [Mycobacterium palustre]MCV7100735.1 DUF3631 domain-containing protein [Mycobacterium palustre]ORW20046.1 DNA primase [Mycobacterium palustre]
MTVPDPNATVALEDGDSIDGAELLDEIDEFLSRYVIYPSEHMRHAHTLWIAHTHFMELWDSTPRIYFKSPEPNSGKTRALEVSEHLVLRGFIALNMSPAALIRKLGDKPENRPTLLMDEVDTIFGPKAGEHEDIRGVLNAGHRRSGTSSRCVVQGNNVEVVDFPAYGAVGLAGLNDLPDTIMSRAVVVAMKRRAPGEKVKPWRIREDEPKAKVLGAQLAKWAIQVKQQLWDGNQYVVAWPDMPDGIADRMADCWEALLACASFAGGHWPLTCHNAALAALAENREMGDAASTGVLLLADLHRIFLSKTGKELMEENTKPALKTQQIIKILVGLDESPWKNYRRDGTALNSRDLSQLLRPYRIKSVNIWWSKDSNGKGYYLKAFEDSWSRYIKEPEPEEQTPPGINGHPMPDKSFLKSTAVEF